MSLLGYVLLIPSLIGCLWGWRWVMRATASDLWQMDNGEIITGCFVGTALFIAPLGAPLWPAYLVYTLVSKAPRPHNNPIHLFAQRFILSTRSERKAKKVLAK